MPSSHDTGHGLMKESLTANRHTCKTILVIFFGKNLFKFSSRYTSAMAANGSPGCCGDGYGTAAFRIRSMVQDTRERGRMLA
jgi:hypothetical protein